MKTNAGPHPGAADDPILTTDSTAMARVRALARAQRPDGEAALRLTGSAHRRLERTLATARRAADCGEEPDASVCRLAREAALIGACADRARREGVRRLPACRGRARVLALAETLLRAGEAPLCAADLLAGVRAFEAVRPLEQRELWAVPQALRVALSSAWASAAASVVSRAGEEAEALRWVRRPGRLPDGRGPAFFERALMACGEAGAIPARERLEARLRAMGASPERVIRQAHDARAFDLMRLDNLMAARRMLDGLDWQACFEALSPVEAALWRDPAGVYPLMDDASRQAVREAVAHIARRTGIDEASVARHAVAAARAEAPAGEPAVDIEALSRRECASEAALRGGVCWWLFDDAGRRALLRRMGREGTRLRQLVPDPRGWRCMAAVAAPAAALAAAFRGLAGGWLWIAGLPIACTMAGALVARLYPRVIRPARCLKLEVGRVPAAWRTLVVMPVLISEASRTAKVCDDLEALGCLDRDDNIEYLLLVDFADADAPRQPGDEVLLADVTARIERMNRAGRARYHLLARPRTLLEADGRWMGRDRKRGALMALNRLLLGTPGAEAAFLPGPACAALKGRFRYVVTLDADTRMLPGTVRKLVGTMAHPMNRPAGGRGWAVMQPRMALMPSACVNTFVRRLESVGGVDTYPVTASSLWMDATGTGVYAGKGIYDVAAFQAALEGALPEGRILSHDLIEGAIAGAASLGDVAFYDGCPSSPGGWFRRLHRWTRGDWQLLPLIVRRGPLPNGQRLRAADRFRMADNLVRSLRAPATWLLLTVGVWRGDAGALAAALLSVFFEAVLSLPARDADPWRRAALRLVMLPATACCTLDAALRALWRLGVSGKHLMDWVPSAEAGGEDRHAALPNRLAALALLPGLLRPGSAPLALALGAVFWFGADWVRRLAGTPATPGRPISEASREILVNLARDTWRFFETGVPSGGAALPPDNVQSDPPAPPVRRTSPTNIGLYLLACVAAARLGFIGTTEADGRIAAAIDAVERTERWNGHLFNWIDIDTLAPLAPRYVSSVDSGNLAACALACAQAVEGRDAALAGRLRALAEGIDFRALYDPDRELFAIGFDAEADRLSQAHYDLLASESRTLSYVAIALGQVPARHWARLGRACVPVGGAGVLLSWSGTMFEYLMPELLLRAPALSLLGESCRGCAAAQRSLGQSTGRPWGVSESGYCAFDMQMNYQYRAFGLPALALGGQAEAGVVAPYAAALALAVCPEAAAEALARMAAMGWGDDCGLYEAADFARGRDGAPALVRSHMAHHQGMLLCAICNALTGDSLIADFMGDPRMRACALLLEERACAAPRRRHRRVTACPERLQSQGWRRIAQPRGRVADVHLLRGREACAFATADGAVHYSRGGVDATRFSGDLVERFDAACVHLTDLTGGTAAVLGGPGSRVTYDAGSASYAVTLGAIRAELRVSLSPEDDTLFRTLTLENAGAVPVRLRAVDVIPVALARPDDWRAHPAFQNLFVVSEPLGDIGLLHWRRSRDPGERCPALAHLAWGGDVRCEARRERVLGRTGDARRAGGVRYALEGGTGATLDPASALSVDAEVVPGGVTRMGFAMKLLADGEDAAAWALHSQRLDLPERAAQLNQARTEAMLAFLGLTPARASRLDRLSALLLDARLAAASCASGDPAGSAPREALWALGISGDRPIVALIAREIGQQTCARALIQAHGFWRAMGIEVDLALVDDGGDGYARPCRDMLSGLMRSSHLSGCEGRPGGAWLLDGSDMSDAARGALLRAAALVVDAEEDFDAQLRGWLMALETHAEAPDPLDIGRSTLPASVRTLDNGFGGFAEDGSYEIDVLPDRLPPVAWCDILAGEAMGALLTERGGGFAWCGNSRFDRLTAWRGDALREGWGLMLWLRDAKTGRALRLLPGDVPQMSWRVRFSPERATYAFEAERLAGETAVAIASTDDALVIDVSLENLGLGAGDWQVVCRVDWLMGADARDAARLCVWQADGACFAAGAMPGAGWLAASETGARPMIGSFPAGGMPARPDGATGCLAVPVRLGREQAARLSFALGWAGDAASARARAERFAAGAGREPFRRDAVDLVVDTPSEAVNRMFNTFLLHQVRASRVLGRTGLYQPGGAYGFRDQLQDMLALIPSEPDRVRAHLLRCAGRQFEAGDVLHWWHEPCLGVRTRISDDRLFLPFVAAAYVIQTGDRAVLDERIPFLEEVPIPEGQSDVFRQMRSGAASGTLHEHCMRAFRVSAATGEHGLALMGSGDWNDGMNRVGDAGRGESIWLTQFLAASADAYAGVAPEEDARWLRALAEERRAALEATSWDGAWYRRAYDDSGRPMGSADCAECRIDLIAQAWAVLCGLNGDRCARAMDAAWMQLVDEAHGIIRLLAPPFDGEGDTDPGYIRGYPPGVRENGAQYTHAACWYVLALIRMGDGARAHRALRMLLPPDHADTPEKAARYRVEPYVVAGDVCAMPGREGQGGWTWYTGSAAWLYLCILELLGYARRGDRVRLRALLGPWPQVALTLHFGGSTYRLICDRKTRAVTLDGTPVGEDHIRLIDDGRDHEARFPARHA